MSEPLLCKICDKRRPKRACPAVAGNICSICCGQEREVSLSCPLDCVHLQEAHRREKPVEVSATELSYPEFNIEESTIWEQEELLLFSAYSLVQAILETAGAIDADVKMAALEALIQTRRSLDSGLIYESRSQNLVAARIQQRFKSSLENYEREREEEDALHPVRNSEILSILVFLYRVGRRSQNGSPRGRMFIDLLRQMTPDGGGVPEAASSIII